MFPTKEVEIPQHLEVAKNEIAVKEADRSLIKLAKEILGRDFLGVEAINNLEKVLSNKIKFVLDNPPLLPYSEKDLKIAKDCGEMLLLRPKTIRIGNNEAPLTLLTLIKLTILLSKKPLGSQQVVFKLHYKNIEESFVDPAKEINLGWCLVKKDVLDGSTSKNWYDQEQLLKKYEEKLIRMGAENTTVRRRTATEAVFDLLLYYERLLPEKYDWGQSQAHVSLFGGEWESFVCVGKFDSLCPKALRILPKFSSVNIGVCPCR